MLSWLAMATMSAALGQFEVEADGVRVRVSINSHDYTVDVKNVGAPPITSFEMEHCNSYNFAGPRQRKVESDGQTFRSWTEDKSRAIGRNETKTFALRAGSKGAVLGMVQVKLGLESGDSVVIPQCWGAIAEPRSTVYLVPLVLAVIFVLHSALTAWRNRKDPAAGSTHP